MTLALIGIALALAGPALIRRTPDASQVAAGLIADARNVATRRGQTVRLETSVNGDWTLSTAGLSDGTHVLRSGKTSMAIGLFAVRISPLGICYVESDRTTRRIDSLTCDISRGPAH